jgi:hypothetical protein
MKTIEQLLQLKKNPYYVFSKEEQEAIDSFLLAQSELPKPQVSSSTSSSKHTPAIVVSKNKMVKVIGEIPTEQAL